jgi:hypothetical protein
VALAADGAPTTELRSIRLDGSSPVVEALPADYQPAPWPWVVDSLGEPAAPVTFLDTRTAITRRIRPGRDEVLNCTPTWCQVLVLRIDGVPLGIDVMRVDGGGRRRVAGADTSTVPGGVSILDRFHVFATAALGRPTGRGFELRLYDTARDRTVVVAADATDVMCQGSFLGWATAGGPAVVWHVLDLQTLR